jgi:hypothetical protein
LLILLTIMVVCWYCWPSRLFWSAVSTNNRDG